jgi:hypothetical protein
MARVVTSLSLLATCFALLSGCASPPTYSSVQGQIGQVASNEGRLFFYRSPVPGVRNRGTGVVLLDNQPVLFDNIGVSFADMPPGPHQISCSGCIDPVINQYKNLDYFEAGQTINFNIVEGESRYVLFDARPTGHGDAARGLRSEHMVLMDPAEGRQEILDLPFIGHLEPFSRLQHRMTDMVKIGH